MEYLFATDAEQKSKELLDAARQATVDLQQWCGHVLKALDEHKGGAFDRGWIDGLQKRVIAVAADVDRANGAVLVRGAPRVPRSCLACAGGYGVCHEHGTNVPTTEQVDEFIQAWEPEFRRLMARIRDTDLAMTAMETAGESVQRG